MSEQSEKELSIECDPSPYQIGQTVEVKLKESLGFYALFLGYLFPFIVLIITMIVASLFTNDEAVIGLASIGSLIPYYLILMLFKTRIKKKFSYFISPLNS
jgi:sigma-E factor negative regulatory protein RseC